MEEEPVGVVGWYRFAQLLECPGGSGMGRHMDVEDTPSRVFHEHEDIQETKGRRHDDAEITGHDGLGMITHKGLPALGCGTFAWPMLPALGHVLPDGPWRHAQAQLQQELIRNALLAPGQVVVGHLPDERLEVRREPRSSDVGFPPPEEPEPLPMPADERRRLDSGQGWPPIAPASEPDERETRGIGGTSGFDITFLIQCQLFPQKEVFCCKSCR
jgi:hypothetical protein